jgi:hypothetical protein
MVHCENTRINFFNCAVGEINSTYHHIWSCKQKRVLFTAVNEMNGAYHLYRLKIEGDRAAGHGTGTA